MKKLRVGIVGTGYIADLHYAGFVKNKDAEIIGMCHTYNRENLKYSEKQDALNLKCKNWGIIAFESFESMLAADTIDALIICSINSLHFEQIMTAINHNKHILAEKPLVTSLSELDEIIALSLQKEVKVFPAHNFVYRNALQKAKALIESGKIGQVIHASFVSSHTISEAHATGWRANKELSMGGAMLDSGHHLIYQSVYLLGNPGRIHGFKSKLLLKNMDCEDTMQLSLQYTDGSMAMLMQTWTSDNANKINGIRILGTHGSIVITDALYFNDKKIAKDVDYTMSFCHQAKAFTNYILKNITPLSDLNDVYSTLHITFEAYKIAENESIKKI